MWESSENNKGILGSCADNSAEVCIFGCTGASEAAIGDIRMSETRGVQNNAEPGIPFIITTLIVLFFLFPQIAFAAMGFTALTVSPHTDSVVRLDWASVPGATVYQVFREDGQNPPVLLQIIDVNAVLNPLTYTDTGLDPDTEYKYTLEAYSDTSPSVLLDTETTTVTTSDLIRPFAVRAEYNINTREAVLDWSSSIHATGSKVNKTENGVTTSIETLSATFARIPVSGIGPAKFTVQSKAGTITSSESEIITVTPIDAPGLTAVSTGGKALISWTGSLQSGRFLLERSKLSGGVWEPWIVLGNVITGSSTEDTPQTGGQYRYRLAAVSGSGYTGYSNISETTTGLPNPSGLTLTFGIGGGIDLSWINGTDNIADIRVLRKNADGSFTQTAQLGNTVSSYHDGISIVLGETYTYKIRAFESAVSYSDSAEVSIKAQIPEPPTKLNAKVTSTGAIELNWADNSGNESGFSVERMTGTGSFAVISTEPANTATYTDVTVFPDNTYVYRIRAFNNLGVSPYSNEVTINAWDFIVPVTLTITPVSATRIDLAWSYPGTGSHNTVIERKTGADGVWAAVYTTAQGALTYSDTGLTPDTRYFYRVRKSLGVQASGVSYPDDNVGRGTSTRLASPTLSGNAAEGGSIYLTWSGNSEGADIIIERKMSTGAFSPLTAVSYVTSGWYDTTGLVPGAAYIYRIKARTASNESLYSNELTVQNLYLEGPTGLRVSVIKENVVELNWVDNSTDETGFEIWKYTYGAGGTYSLYATVDKNITKFTDTLIQPGVQYYYMVRAYVASGSIYSSYSNAASIGIGLINPPVDLHYNYISNTQVLLKWVDTSDNESGFGIERKIGLSGEWIEYGRVGSNVTSWVITDLNPYTKYYFRVRAFSYEKNADSLSEEIMVSTAVPASPSDLQALPLSSSQVKLSWKDNSDSEEGFRIFRRPANAYYYVPLVDVAKDTTAFLDTNLYPGMKYFYKVVSYNSIGPSDGVEAEVRTQVKVTFNDLASVETWAKDAIESLAGMGIVKGVSGEGLFNPNGKTTKAEFTAMIVRAFEMETTPVGSFADVKPGKWYYKEVMTAENFGIIYGDEQNRFFPERYITREEMALILFKALQMSKKEFTGSDNSVLEKFSDRDMISPYALAGMAALVSEGIIEGMSSAIIAPKYTATRAQAAVLLYRALKV